MGIKKGLLALAMVFLLAGASWAISWHTANQKVIGWDAYENVDGNAGDSISYKVYLKNNDTLAETFVAETFENSMLLTFVTEGRYLAGVRNVRKVDINLDGTYDENDVDENGDPVILESTITWSDSDDMVAVPIPFGLRFFVGPKGTKGLIVQ